MKARVSIDQLELTVEAQPKRKRRKTSDTSRAAEARTRTTRTEQLRALILSTIEACARDESMRGATADEVHVRTAETEQERYDVRRLMEIRRRLSDLHARHQIRDAHFRRLNDAGNSMIVWEPGDGRIS